MISLFAQSGSGSFLQLFNNPTFIFFGFVALIVIVPSALMTWSKVKTSEHRAALVQDLAARGMTPQEIKDVLAAAKLDKNIS